MPDNWKLYIDLSPIENLLSFFDQAEKNMEKAQKIANHPAFLEMLKHRRSLGYIPEPFPDSADLALFIFSAASQDPLQMIWKWLNPWNDFCLADLYMKKEKFTLMISSMKEHRAQLEKYILRKISQYTDKPVRFTDTLVFAVNWGIRSWATTRMLGSNLVQYKDDYQIMLRTLTHETFHRIQLQICPVDPSRRSGKVREFEDVTFRNFPDKKDRKLYETLSYIMLEGTATFTGGIHSSWQVDTLAVRGAKLLHEIYNALYVRNDFDTYDRLLNQGLKSNGPFYALGYYMTNKIVKKKGKSEIGKILRTGAPAFFLESAQLIKESEDPLFSFEKKLMNRIMNLRNDI
ncbi:MAG: hypothetical protein Kow00108_16930 [Calditrichia bacterium]